MQTQVRKISPMFALCAALAVAGLSAGCDGSKAPEAEADGSKAAGDDAAKGEGEGEDAPIAGKDVDGPGKAGVVTGEIPSEDDRFILSVDVPNEAAAGKQGKVTVRVEPSGPWHMNLDYPTSLKMEPTDGVKLAKTEQKKVDAVKLDENSCEYEIAFTPEGAGDKAFKGEFKFAVCQDDACSPVTKDIAFQVAVK